MSVKPEDSLKLQGRVEILAIARKTGEILCNETIPNIVLYQGNAEVIKTLFTITPATKPRLITRMAIGDQGTIPADSQVAKVPTKDLAGLYHEIYRADADSSTQTTSGSTNQCELIATFNATSVPLSAFSNPAQPRVNEVGLVIIDPTAAGGIVRAPVISPAIPASDETVASIRCFKSIPFEAANDVSVTIRYTIFLA